MKLEALLAILALGAPLHHARADAFKNVTYSLGALVKKGSLLECDIYTVPDREHAPKTYEWAFRSGLIEVSKVTQTAAWSQKVTTKDDSRQRVLIVGCWITTAIVKETVNGTEAAFAKGVYRLNDLVKGSPLADAPVCVRKRKPGTPFGQNDYRVAFEGRATACETDEWNERVESLAQIEGREELFELKKPLFNKPGYVRSIGY